MGRYGMTEETRVEAGPVGDLTKAEQARLGEILTEIDAGMTAWVRIGELLEELRANRLYRQTHDKFEDFCRERWGWASRARITQYIGSSRAAHDYAKRAADVNPGLTLQLTSEKAARPLSRVQSPDRDAVVSQLVVLAPDGQVDEKVAKEAVEAAGVLPREEYETLVVECPRCGGTGKSTKKRKVK